MLCRRRALVVLMVCACVAVCMDGSGASDTPSGVVLQVLDPVARWAPRAGQAFRLVAVNGTGTWSLPADSACTEVAADSVWSTWFASPWPSWEAAGGNITVVCEAAGVHGVLLARNGSQETVEVDVGAPAPCFEWSVSVDTTYNGTVPAEVVGAFGGRISVVLEHQQLATIPLVLRLVPGLAASEEDALWAADAPPPSGFGGHSAASERVTRELASLGEAPSIAWTGAGLPDAMHTFEEASGRVSDVTHPLALAQGPEWDDDAGGWRLVLTTDEAGEYALAVASRRVTILGCWAGDRVFSLDVTPYNTTTLALASASPAAPPMPWAAPAPSVPATLSQEALRPAYSACVAGLGALPLATPSGSGSDPTVLVTAGGWAQAAPVVLACPGCASGVRSVAWAGAAAMVAVAGDGSVATLAGALEGTRNTSAWATGVFNSTDLAVSASVAHVRGPSACDGCMSGHLVAWGDTSHAGGTGLPLWVSVDAGRVWRPAVIAAAVGSAGMSGGVRVRDAAVVPACGGTLVLVEDAGGAQAVVAVPATGCVTEGREPELRAALGHTVNATRLEAARTGTGEVVAAGGGVAYSPNCGATFHSVGLYGGDGGLGLRPGETVTHTAGAPSTQLVVATTSAGRTFVGTLGAGEWQELLHGVSLAARLEGGPSAAPTRAVLPHVDPLTHEAALLRVAAGEPWASVVPVSVAFQVPSVGGGCPVEGFARADSSTAAAVFLDRGEQTTLGVAGVARDQDAAVSVAVSRADLLKFEVSEAVPGAVTLVGSPAEIGRQWQWEVTVSEQAPEAWIRTVGYVDQSDVRVAARPEQTTLGCADAATATIVRVGCPPGRHIRVRTHPGCTSGVKGYKIPGNVRLGGQGDLWVEYSYAEHGCPYDVYYGTEGFRPIVDLYDGDTFIEQLDAEYVMYEINDRWDYSYNTTIEEAECTRAPMTWKQAQARRPNDRDRSWLPQDHESCLDPLSSAVIASSDVYEIFTASTNGLTFTGGTDGLFVFRIRVVDPMFSYCELTASFGVVVFGAPLSVLLQVLVIGGVVLLTLILLVLSYFFYKYSLKRKHLATAESDRFDALQRQQQAQFTSQLSRQQSAQDTLHREYSGLYSGLKAQRSSTASHRAASPATGAPTGGIGASVATMPARGAFQKKVQ